MEEFPKSILELILSNLDKKQILNCSIVCKKWNRGEFKKTLFSFFLMLILKSFNDFVFSFKW